MTQAAIYRVFVNSMILLGKGELAKYSSSKLPTSAWAIQPPWGAHQALIQISRLATVLYLRHCESVSQEIHHPRGEIRSVVMRSWPWNHWYTSPRSSSHERNSMRDRCIKVPIGALSILNNFGICGCPWLQARNTLLQRWKRCRMSPSRPKHGVLCRNDPE